MSSICLRCFFPLLVLKGTYDCWICFIYLFVAFSLSKWKVSHRHKFRKLSFTLGPQISPSFGKSDPKGAADGGVCLGMGLSERSCLFFGEVFTLKATSVFRAGPFAPKKDTDLGLQAQVPGIVVDQAVVSGTVLLRVPRDCHFCRPESSKLRELSEKLALRRRFLLRRSFFFFVFCGVEPISRGASIPANCAWAWSDGKQRVQTCLGQSSRAVSSRLRLQWSCNFVFGVG